MLNLSGIKRVQIISIFVAVAFLLGSATPPICWAADPTAVTQGTERPKRIDLVVGKSIIMRSPIPVKRVSLASPEIAEFVLISPSQIYLIGKKPGITNMTLWENNRISAIYDLEVSPDISRLKEKLHQILPDETGLHVITTHESITLSGTISSTVNLSQALALANSYAPKGKVINLVQVGGVHQVMLEVKVAEISRSLIKRLGFNFNVFGRKALGATLLGNLTEFDELAGLGEPMVIGVSQAVNALFQFQSEGVTTTGLIDALKEDGLVKILAEPTLIALSGQTADFLAGGEFPVPVPQGLGTVGIEYKSFGVGVRFMPTVLSNNKISIKVAPEASQLDFSTAVLLEGFVVPGVSTRRASTVIELADGQSFAIAGLLSENIREIISKFPLLGSIPILGALFRSSSFQKNETELIIIVTPHLVKPLDLAKQSLPTDAYVEPNDVQFFLWGVLEGRKKKKSSGNKPSLSQLDKKGGLEGEFGHIIP